MDPHKKTKAEQRRPNIEEIFAALDQAGLPDDFLADREQDTAEVRDDLFSEAESPVEPSADPKSSEP